MWKTAARGVSKWGEELTQQIKFEIEHYWKDYVTKKASYNVKPDANKYYVLSMFPYPSGQLHMGHVRVYSISDSISRFHKMTGKRVIHPMGWDAFGLPAENAAIDRKLSPKTWTEDNVSKMKEQLFRLGCDFDWSREINTSHPEYYKWTQTIFLELFRAGLVYKKEAYVNWDPIDQTVLADEQVDINGCSWRSGAKIEKKLLNQWFVKTTYFAKDLYDGLNDPSLENWKDIIQMQRHWIGECNGITIDFKLKSAGLHLNKITAWTDKPESVAAAQFLVLPPTSMLNIEKLTAEERDGIKRMSVTAINPITDAELPIFICGGFEFPEGSDAHVGSPYFNETDRIYADKFNIESSFDDKLAVEDLRRNVCSIAMNKNIGGYPVSSKLKDWLISRQRYWGTPIPMVSCESCGIQPVPDDQLPVTLPEINSIERSSQSPLKTISEWINTECPKCKGPAQRETDTMDTFVDSSWYYLRYLDYKNVNEPFTKSSAHSNMPVDVYIGGKEHAVLHLYYARFMNHFLHSIGRLPCREPFKRLLVQGMVMGRSFQVDSTGKYLPASEVTITDDKAGRGVDKQGEPVTISWEKMSKSKYNGVEPSEIIDTYGCDTTRLLMLSDVSPVSPRHWSLDTLPGIVNWQNRLWKLMSDFIDTRAKYDGDKSTIIASDDFKKSEHDLWDSRNYFVVNSTYNYDFTHQLSIAISRMQGLTNSLKRCPLDFMPLSSEFEKAFASQILMLAPIIPHFASELWTGFLQADRRINDSLVDWNKNLMEQSWPVADDNYKLDFICFVNNSIVYRTKLFTPEINAMTVDRALDLAMVDKKVQKMTAKGIGNLRLQLNPYCRAVIFIKPKKSKSLKVEEEAQLSA